nr:RepB family.p replication initiator protein [Serratia entomophila]
MNVFNMASLDTPFAFRLYSWLSRYRNLDKYKIKKSGVISTEPIALDWMKDRAGLLNKYKDFKNFRVRVLDPAVDVINRTTDLTVKMKLSVPEKKLQILCLYILLKMIRLI